MADPEYPRPLKATLCRLEPEEIPDPTTGLRWPEVTSFVGGHLPARRLERAGFLTHATEYEASFGELDVGGPGMYRTTEELFEAIQTVACE